MRISSLFLCVGSFLLVIIQAQEADSNSLLSLGPQTSRKERYKKFETNDITDVIIKSQEYQDYKNRDLMYKAGKLQGLGMIINSVIQEHVPLNHPFFIENPLFVPAMSFLGLTLATALYTKYQKTKNPELDTDIQQILSGYQAGDITRTRLRKNTSRILKTQAEDTARQGAVLSDIFDLIGENLGRLDDLLYKQTIKNSDVHKLEERLRKIKESIKPRQATVSSSNLELYQRAAATATFGLGALTGNANKSRLLDTSWSHHLQISGIVGFLSFMTCDHALQKNKESYKKKLIDFAENRAQTYDWNILALLHNDEEKRERKKQDAHDDLNEKIIALSRDFTSCENKIKSADLQQQIKDLNALLNKTEELITELSDQHGKKEDENY